MSEVFARGSIAGTGDIIVIQVDAAGTVTVSTTTKLLPHREYVPVRGFLTAPGKFIGLNVARDGSYTLAADVLGPGVPCPVVGLAFGYHDSIWLTDESGTLDFSLGFAGTRTPAVSANVAQFFARLTPGETNAFKTACAGFINGMGAAFNRLDWLYFRGTTIRANATINARQVLYPSVQAGGMPDGQHTPGGGWTGDGNIGHYLDNGCDPTVAPGLNFTLNAASIGVHVKAGAKSGSQFAFGNGNFYVEPYFGGDTLTYWRAHGAADLSVASPATLTGIWHVIRTSAGASKLRKDGADLATSAAASSAIKNQTLKSLGGDVDSSTLTLDIEWGGASTQADIDLIDTLIPTFFP